jgi:cyclophilin family peptidyl-prolyl cis-trans isomerase
VRGKARGALASRGVLLPGPQETSAEASALLEVRFEDDPVVTLVTSKGEIRIRCLAHAAPIHVASFVSLVREGFYDGLTWHRVVSNFVIQGGDPRGDGWGGAGYTLRDEINSSRYGRGSVGMPKAGKDTGGGQIFITHVPTPHLDGNYTVFGQVVSGLDVVDRIEVGDAIIRARVD